jgi:AcrR family transcriptional regulator
MTATTHRAPRADSQRNYAALVDAAKEVFAAKGVDTPVEEVAKVAGFGKGTLYRHFPTREHLLAAVMADRFEMLRALSVELGADADIMSAIRRWLNAYVESARPYPGIGSGIGSTLAGGGEAMTSACAQMRDGFGELLTRAQAEGFIRGDVTAREVLILVSTVTGPSTISAELDALYLDIVTDGLLTSKR